jgi:hypothetical protein
MTTDAVAHDAAYYLALIDRVNDPAYLEPFKVTPASGYELLEAYADLGARASTAAARLETGCVIIFAEGGAFAEGVVQLSRPTAAAGEVTVKAGTIVASARNARLFATTVDTVFGVGVFGPLDAPVRALRMGWEYNARGETTTATGVVLPGEVRRMVLLVEEPPYGDPTIVVSQQDDFAGGRAPMLDALGEDLGQPRQPGETDPAYRLRLRSLPDVVTPNAVRRAIAAFCGVYPFLATQFIETFEVGYQTCYDAPTAAIPASPTFDPTCFVYDDPRSTTPFRNRWLDSVEHVCAFIVVVPLLATVRMLGCAYDDLALSPAAHVAPSTLGTRGYAAYDVPDTFDPALGYGGAYDGDDLGANGFYGGLYQRLQAVKAAGISAILELGLEGN